MTASGKRHGVFIIVFLAALILTLWEEFGLRPYLQKNHITTFYLADSLPNFLVVVLLSFGTMAVLAYRENKDIFKSCWKFTLGTLLYEFFQATMPERTFDPKDIIASVIAGIFSYLVLIFINTRLNSLIQPGDSLPRHAFIRYEKSPNDKKRGIGV